MFPVDFAKRSPDILGKSSSIASVTAVRSFDGDACAIAHAWGYELRRRGVLSLRFGSLERVSLSVAATSISPFARVQWCGNVRVVFDVVNSAFRGSQEADVEVREMTSVLVIDEHPLVLQGTYGQAFGLC